MYSHILLPSLCVLQVWRFFWSSHMTHMHGAHTRAHMYKKQRKKQKHCFELSWSTYCFGNTCIWWWQPRFSYMRQCSAYLFLLFVPAFLLLISLSLSQQWCIMTTMRGTSVPFIVVSALIDLLFPKEPYLCYQYNTVTYLGDIQACCCLIPATSKPNLLHLFLFLSCL